MFGIAMTAASSLAQSGWNNHMWGAGWGWWMALMMIVFWSLVIGLAVTFTRNSGRRTAPDDDPMTTAQALLAERLARGEIDPAEYRERLDTLR